MKYFFLSAVINTVVCWVHPLHISVCEMEYDDVRRSLEITQRIFLDDLELEMRNELGSDDLVLTDLGKTEADKLFQMYINNHIDIYLDKSQKEISYVGYELDRDAVFIYFEILKIDKPRNVRVKNDILMNYYEDQVNLVHIEIGEELQSLKMEGLVIQGEVNFER